MYKGFCDRRQATDTHLDGEPPTHYQSGPKYIPKLLQNLDLQGNGHIYCLTMILHQLNIEHSNKKLILFPNQNKGGRLINTQA